MGEDRTEMVRIVVVADDRLWIDAIAVTLARHPDFSVVGKLTDPERAETVAASSDVILVHHNLQDPGAERVVRNIHNVDEDIGIIVVGVPETSATLVRYFEAGATGYVRSDDPLDKLISVIEEASRGETSVDREIAAVLVDRLADLHRVLDEVTPTLPDNANLTPREETVLTLIAEGKTNLEIANELFIEVGTVKNHVHSILQKLNVGDRQQAAYYLKSRDTAESE